MALANLTMGQRDALLLLLREQTFGPTLDSVAKCPRCQEQLEFSLNTQEIRVIDVSDDDVPDDAIPNSLSHAQYQCDVEGMTIQFRLPTSVDVAAVTLMAQPEQVRVNLARRCLLTASQNGNGISIEQLEVDEIATFADHLAQVDPQAEILLNLQCPACQHDWQIVFDIVSYLWAELVGYAKRLLIDVHQLARAYGWSEADILAMSNNRRQYYLELVT